MSLWLEPAPDSSAPRSPTPHELIVVMAGAGGKSTAVGEMYRERMIYLEEERNEWLGQIQALKTENARLRRALQEYNAMAKHVQTLSEKYPPHD